MENESKLATIVTSRSSDDPVHGLCRRRAGRCDGCFSSASGRGPPMCARFDMDVAVVKSLCGSHWNSCLTPSIADVRSSSSQLCAKVRPSPCSFSMALCLLSCFLFVRRELPFPVYRVVCVLSDVSCCSEGDVEVVLIYSGACRGGAGGPLMPVWRVGEGRVVR
jgi:hypothetical protein